MTQSIKKIIEIMYLHLKGQFINNMRDYVYNTKN